MTHTHARAADGRTPAATAARPADLPPGVGHPALTPTPRGEGGPPTRTALAGGAHAELPGVGDSARPGPAGQRGEALPAGPRVIGWDLSIAGTGTASPTGDLHTIPTKTEDGDRRLLTIEQYLIDSAVPLGCNAADFAVLEDLPRNANAAGVTGMVHGLARRILLEAGIPYVLVVPASLKKYATGNGGATKADMRMALFQRMGIDERDDNRVDAFWLRCMGLDWFGAAPVQLPKVQREAMLRAAKKGNWPDLAALDRSGAELW